MLPIQNFYLTLVGINDGVNPQVELGGHIEEQNFEDSVVQQE